MGGGMVLPSILTCDPYGEPHGMPACYPTRVLSCTWVHGLFSSWHPRSLIQIRQLWGGKQPGLTFGALVLCIKPTSSLPVPQFPS